MLDTDRTSHVSWLLTVIRATPMVTPVSSHGAGGLSYSTDGEINAGWRKSFRRPLGRMRKQ